MEIPATYCESTLKGVRVAGGTGSIRAELYVSVLCAMFRWQDRRIYAGPACAIRPINSGDN